MKKSTVVATFHSDVETVWNIVTNNSVFGWRSDLSKITVSDDGKCFSEFAKNDFETEFVITQKIPYERYEFDIKNKNMSGHWVGIFSREGTGTRIEFTEEVSVANPIMNLFIDSYMKKQQSVYISDLRKALGEKN
ncbi:MAG: polyketide cyclase [Oscillospiraceae bacterium]